MLHAVIDFVLFPSQCALGIVESHMKPCANDLDRADILKQKFVEHYLSRHHFRIMFQLITGPTRTIPYILLRIVRGLPQNAANAKVKGGKFSQVNLTVEFRVLVYDLGLLIDAAVNS